LNIKPKVFISSKSKAFMVRVAEETVFHRRIVHNQVISVSLSQFEFTENLNKKLSPVP
jgi:hypothetical protein